MNATARIAKEPNPPELLALVQALARQAAKRDYAAAVQQREPATK